MVQCVAVSQVKLVVAVSRRLGSLPALRSSWGPALRRVFARAGLAAGGSGSPAFLTCMAPLHGGARCPFTQGWEGLFAFTKL